LFNFHSGFDGIDRSPNFGPLGVPVASGGSNPFAGVDTTGSLHGEDGLLAIYMGLTNNGGFKKQL
jgi:hypothetical protein